MGALPNIPVLLVNQNYEPLNICDVRRAVVLLTRGKAELLENGQGEIHTSTRAIPFPSVIRLAYMVRRPFMKRHLARREVFLRDNFTCQYCGKQTRELTLDHVMPRHRGGAHQWENVVSACIPCNHRKAGHTPAEAGLKLRQEPRAPKPHPYSLFHHRTLRQEWRKFVPWLASQPSHEATEQDGQSPN
ncbi:MAG: HNH endonuclease [Chloroflexi bacterium]|nr:HNH endonuclease [Chloroflexota bacterium]